MNCINFLKQRRLRISDETVYALENQRDVVKALCPYNYF